ncbi:MAG TPA: hypothetical protein VKF40_06795 [Burkholderiales bacterium]|nr:hypothetical protein [Burkholderiales bacterium]
MNLIIYIFSASFILMSIAMLFAYRRTLHYGLFLMGLTYGGSAGLALVLMHWWPLMAGFILVWILKLIGLDPDSELRKREKKDQR